MATDTTFVVPPNPTGIYTIPIGVGGGGGTFSTIPDPLNNNIIVDHTITGRTFTAEHITPIYSDIELTKEDEAVIKAELMEKIVHELFKEKYNLNDDTLNDEDEVFGENPVRCYNDRFECLTCRKVVCDTCIQHIPQENGATGDFTEKFTCPMCRTKDYRFQIGSSNLSVEILRDIKNFKNK